MLSCHVPQVEISCVGARLGDDMSLEYVRKTHWRGHDEHEDIQLQYRRIDVVVI